jgi:hypothetical protein
MCQSAISITAFNAECCYAQFRNNSYYAKCSYAESRGTLNKGTLVSVLYAKCHYTKYPYAKCRLTALNAMLSVMSPSMVSVVTLCVVELL